MTAQSEPTTTTMSRARQRARESRLRAICNLPGRWYTVWNLTKRVKYLVWFNVHRDDWECTCRTNNAQHICKHVARVKDREERRVKREYANNR